MEDAPAGDRKFFYPRSRDLAKSLGHSRIYHTKRSERRARDCAKRTKRLHTNGKMVSRRRSFLPAQSLITDHYTWFS